MRCKQLPGRARNRKACYPLPGRPQERLQRASILAASGTGMQLTLAVAIETPPLLLPRCETEPRVAVGGSSASHGKRTAQRAQLLLR